MGNLKDSLQKRISLIKSWFYKRNDRVVLMGSWMGEKFADNTRYLYQYLFDNREKLGLEHVVWVTRKQSICDMLNDMGYEAYMMDSSESLYFHKHAGIHIICNAHFDTSKNFGDIMGIYSYGAKCVDLWHGIGLKGVGYASNSYRRGNLEIKVRSVRQRIEGGWRNRYLLSTTAAATEIFDKYFKLPKDRYIESAYPRNCIVPKLTMEEEKVFDKLKNYEAIVMYLPTFRTGGDTFYFMGYSDVLVETLKSNNILWIQKSHSVDKENHTNNSMSDNVMNLDVDFDINVLLPHITLLVTDYSSVLFDAMYHNKPILYLVPDFEKYKNGDRGFVINADDVMCGPRFSSIEELRDNLTKYCKNPELAKSDNYQDVRERYWGTEKKGLKEIWNDIIKHIE